MLAARRRPGSPRTTSADYEYCLRGGDLPPDCRWDSPRLEATTVAHRTRTSTLTNCMHLVGLNVMPQLTSRLGDEARL